MLATHQLPPKRAHIFTRRTPLLRLSPVSTFLRLNKLGRFGLEKKIVKNFKGAGGGGPGGLPPDQGIENIAPDTLLRLG